jgi:hypothetical protein
MLPVSVDAESPGEERRNKLGAGWRGERGELGASRVERTGDVEIWLSEE